MTTVRTPFWRDPAFARLTTYVLKGSGTREERVRRYVEMRVLRDEVTGCLIYQGTTRNGYGRFVIDGHWLTAHRAYYEATIGPIPAGQHLDHLCRNKACVLTAHLEVVSANENFVRGKFFARKESCKHGHPFDEANTRWHVVKPPTGNRYVRRVCRACKRETSRRLREVQRGRH